MSVRLTPLCKLAALFGALILAALVGAPAGQAAITPWGELGHFGSSPGELNEPQPAFGVNPEDGSAWAVDVSGEEFRIQKFEGGKVVASRKFGKDEGFEENEAGIEVEGVAFDPSKKRAYVLVSEERTANPEKGVQAASELWAFSTSTSGGKIEFAPETTNGVLVPRTAEDLKNPIGQTKFAPDDTEKISPGPSLLAPSGIAVNPNSHQIIVTGWVGKSEKESPTVWAISEKGKIEGDWEDESKFFEDCGCISSPVVTSSGKILVLGEQEEGQGENIYQIPSGLKSSEAPKRAFWLPILKKHCEELEEEKALELCPFVEKLTTIKAGEGSLPGGEMTIGSEGDIYLHIAIPDKSEGENLFGGVMVLTSNLQEIGWTGGGSSASSSKACSVNESGEGGGGAALLGAYEETVMMYERGEPKREQQKVLELGTGGKIESCPHGSATAPSATVGGVKLTKFPLADKIVFSSNVVQANALSTEWEFEHGVAGGAAETVKARQQETTRVEHKYATPGTYTVLETIHTDDLATPEVKAETKVTIAGPTIRKTEAVVEGTSVTLKAEVDPNGQVTKCHFEYVKGTEAAKAVECPKAPGEGETYVAETVKVEKLAAGEYHYRLVANEIGVEEETFVIAEAGAPVATTLAASELGITTATLNGTVDPEGHATTCKFEYGTSSVSEKSQPCTTEPGSGTSAVTESVSLSGLTPNTSYKVRIAAESTAEHKKAAGSELAFTTAARLVPTVETLGAASVTETAATLTGKVNPRGEATTCKFLYGPTTAYGHEAPCSTVPGAGFSSVGVTASISGLSAGTIYHYKLVAENAVGSASGSDQELRSVSTPEPAKTAITPPGTTVPPPAAEAVPKIAISGTSLTVASSGGFSLRLTCPGGLTQCAGTLTFKTLTAVAAKAKKSILTLATASFTIAAGKLKVLAVHLTRKGRALLAKDHTVRARLTISAHNPQGETSTTTAIVTFKPAKKKKR